MHKSIIFTAQDAQVHTRIIILFPVFFHYRHVR